MEDEVEVAWAPEPAKLQAECSSNTKNLLQMYNVLNCHTNVLTPECAKNTTKMVLNMI